MIFKIGQEVFVPAFEPTMGTIAGERGLGTGKEYKIENPIGDDVGWWAEEELVLAHDARTMFTEDEREEIRIACGEVELPYSGGKPLDVLIPHLPTLSDRLAALSREYPKSNKQHVILRSIAR